MKYVIFPKQLIGSILMMFALLISIPARAQETEYGHSSLVIVQVPDMSNEQYQKISEVLISNQQFSLEYTCRESNIIVLKYYHNFTEEGDVKMAVRTNLARQVVLPRLIFVYVDVSQELSTQC